MQYIHDVDVFSQAGWFVVPDILSISNSYCGADM